LDYAPPAGRLAGDGADHCRGKMEHRRRSAAREIAFTAEGQGLSSCAVVVVRSLFFLPDPLSFFSPPQRNHSREFFRIHNSLAQQQLREERKPICYAL